MTIKVDVQHAWRIAFDAMDDPSLPQSLLTRITFRKVLDTGYDTATGDLNPTVQDYLKIRMFLRKYEKKDLAQMQSGSKNIYQEDVSGLVLIDELPVIPEIDDLIILPDSQQLKIIDIKKEPSDSLYTFKLRKP